MVRTTMLDTRIGSIELDKGMPATDDDMRCLFDASDFQRACQANDVPGDNWLDERSESTPGSAWFAYFRLYEPLEAFFAHRFALPDFELMNGHHH